MKKNPRNRNRYLEIAGFFISIMKDGDMERYRKNSGELRKDVYSFALEESQRSEKRVRQSNLLSAVTKMLFGDLKESVQSINKVRKIKDRDKISKLPQSKTANIASKMTESVERKCKDREKEIASRKELMGYINEFIREIILEFKKIGAEKMVNSKTGFISRFSNIANIILEAESLQVKTFGEFNKARSYEYQIQKKIPEDIFWAFILKLRSVLVGKKVTPEVFDSYMHAILGPLFKNDLIGNAYLREVDSEFESNFNEAVRNETM